MAAKLRVRRPTQEEGAKLLRIVRRGHKYKATVYRRAVIITASAGGNDVRVIANLVRTSPDRVREVIHAFNEQGLDSLDPKWAGARVGSATRTAPSWLRSRTSAPARWASRSLAGA